MSYIDCYLTPVARTRRAQYETLAQISSEAVREYGANRVVECWLDEMGPEASTCHGVSARQSSNSYGSFGAAAGAKESETVVLSWVEWPDKSRRDEGMAKLTADPRMQFADQEPVFDVSRLIAAGFIPVLDSARGV